MRGYDVKREARMESQPRRGSPYPYEAVHVLGKVTLERIAVSEGFSSVDEMLDAPVEYRKPRFCARIAYYLVRWAQWCARR